MPEVVKNITDFKTHAPVGDSLRVDFKNEILLLIVFVTFFFGIFSFFLLKSHKFFGSVLILTVLIIFLVKYYFMFFPTRLPYLLINSEGILNKRKLIPWEYIETIKYQIMQPNVYLSGVYLIVALKNEKEISIDVNPKAINSSIEVIAAYIQKYWPNKIEASS